jgi:hypothetical protein
MYVWFSYASVPSELAYIQIYTGVSTKGIASRAAPLRHIRTDSGDSRLSFESVGGELGIGLGITLHVGVWLSLLGIVVGNIMLIGGGLWDIFLSKALFFLAE